MHYVIIAVTILRVVFNQQGFLVFAQIMRAIVNPGLARVDFLGRHAPTAAIRSFQR